MASSTTPSDVEMQPFSRQSAELSSGPLLHEHEDKVADTCALDFPFEKWPKSPRTLDEATPSLLKRVLPQALLLIIPLLFLVLGVYVAKLNGRPESARGEVIMQATKIASTLWPIAFAAVVGPMLKAIALYCAEKGTKLRTLEVLTTSQTLISTIRNVHFISIWTFLLIIVWLLSPTGGQAVLRSIEKEVEIDTQTIPIIYYPSNNISNGGSSSLNGASSGASARGRFKRAIAAALTSPDVTVMHSEGSSPAFNSAVEALGGERQAALTSQNDLWGNVRIPFVHLLPGYDPKTPFEWVNISSDKVAPYESLIGIPIRGVPALSIGNLTLEIHTMYHSFMCSQWFNGTSWLGNNPRRLVAHRMSNSSIFEELHYGDAFPAPIAADKLISATVSPAKTPSGSTLERADFMFAWRTNGDINMTLCEDSVSFVDTEVKCVRAGRGGKLSCSAMKIRHTAGYSTFSNQTAYNMSGVGMNWWSIVLGGIPDTLPAYHPSEPSGLQNYLKDPPTAFKDNYNYPDYYDIPMDVFQARLGLIFNTFYKASLNTTTFFGADGMTLYQPNSVYESTYGRSNGIWAEQKTKKYEITIGWFSLYMAATLVLLVCALTTVIIHCVIRVPDIFGGVSGLTRDSPYINIPAGGSALASTDRASILRDKWVQIQDTKSEEDVGRIVFGDKRELKLKGQLQWKRLYE